MISIVSVKTRRLLQVKDAFLKMFKDLDYIPKNNNIFLKPNIVDAVTYREASITDPNVTGGIILALNEIGGKNFIIGENSGFFSSKSENFEILIKNTRYKKLVEDLNKKYGLDVEIFNLNDDEMLDYDWPWGKGKIKIPKICKTHEYINIAKLKTHMHTTVTLSMKNQKGLLKLNDKKQFHLGYQSTTNLHETISKLGEIIQPDFSIVDGTLALEGSGPTTSLSGLTSVRKVGLCIGGKDMLEVDNACCKLMDIPIDLVEHLKEVPIIISQNSVPLDPLDPPFKRAGRLMKIGNIHLHVHESMCTQCQLSYSRTVRKILFTPEFKEKFHLLQKKYSHIDMYMGRGALELIEGQDDNEHPRIFFGNCANKSVGDLKGLNIPKCPPDYREAAKMIVNLVDENLNGMKK